MLSIDTSLQLFCQTFVTIDEGRGSRSVNRANKTRKTAVRFGENIENGEIAGKPFEISALIDTYVFAYSCVLANKDNPSLEFDEFIDACDADPSIIEEFNKFMEEEMKKRELLSKKKVTKKGKKSAR